MGGVREERERGRDKKGKGRTGLGTCMSIRQSKSRLGCAPEFTSLGILRSIFLLSSGYQCLFASALP